MSCNNAVRHINELLQKNGSSSITTLETYSYGNGMIKGMPSKTNDWMNSVNNEAVINKSLLDISRKYGLDKRPFRTMFDTLVASVDKNELSKVYQKFLVDTHAPFSIDDATKLSFDKKSFSDNPDLSYLLRFDLLQDKMINEVPQLRNAISSCLNIKMFSETADDSSIFEPYDSTDINFENVDEEISIMMDGIERPYLRPYNKIKIKNIFMKTAGLNLNAISSLFKERMMFEDVDYDDGKKPKRARITNKMLLDSFQLCCSSDLYINEFGRLCLQRYDNFDDYTVLDIADVYDDVEANSIR